MSKLDDALRRQQAVQHKRTIAWGLFATLVPVSLLFWLEVVFALGNLSELGVLQPLAELVIAIASTLAAVHMYRSGMRFNKLLADPSRLLDDDFETEL